MRSESQKLLDLDVDLIDTMIYEMALERKIVIERLGDYNIIYLGWYYKAEVGVCNRLIRLTL